MIQRVVTGAIAVVVGLTLSVGLLSSNADAAASTNKTKALSAAKKWCGKSYLLQHPEDIKPIKTKKNRTIGYQVVLMGDEDDSDLSVKICQVSVAVKKYASPKHKVTNKVKKGDKTVKSKSGKRTTGVLGLKYTQPWETTRTYTTVQKNKKYGNGTAKITIERRD